MSGAETHHRSRGTVSYTHLFHWTDLVWDERVFPDPEGMLKRIKEKGLNICVWINPYIGQESVMFEEGKEKGYFLKRENEMCIRDSYNTGK